MRILCFFIFFQNPRKISFKTVLLTLYLSFHLKSGKIIFLKQLYNIWYEAEQFACWAHRWKDYFIAYNSVTQQFAQKCNPDLLRIFFFNKSEKKCFAHYSSGVHFRPPPPPIQFFTQLGLPYHLPSA